jgi:hypothetical protein
MWSCRFEMGLVGFGEVRLAMKDVCGGGENDARASTTTVARPRPSVNVGTCGGWLLVVTGGSATVSCIDEQTKAVTVSLYCSTNPPLRSTEVEGAGGHGRRTTLVVGTMSLYSVSGHGDFALIKSANNCANLVSRDGVISRPCIQSSPK